MTSANSSTHQRRMDDIVLVALQKRKNEYILDRMNVNDSKNGAVFMRRLNEKYRNDIGCHAISRMYRWGLCLDLVVDDQPLSSITFIDLESQSYPCGVFVESTKYSSMLTKAFYEPSDLQSVRNFTTRYSSLVAADGAPAVLPLQRVIVVRYEINKPRACFMLLTALISSLVIGVGAGVLGKNANLGVAVGAGLFACVAVVQGLLVWVFH